jgi:hypothetical protein
MNEILKSNRKWRIGRRILIGLAIFATLVAIFYTEEDWRGKRAWENCKRELEAKGVVMDWEKLIPPPVPDDQNFYTASTNIALRFVKARTAETADAASRLQWLRPGPPDPVVVAEVTVISSNLNAAPGDADLYLRYNHSVLTVGTSREDLTEPQSPFLPFFDLKDVPLKSAIERTAQAAKLNYTIDPKVNSADSRGKPILVAIRWKNVTARQALLALLDNFDLVLIEDSKTGIARILPKTGQIHADPYATKEINRVLSPVLNPDTNRFQGAGLKGALGIWFFAKSPLIRPAHIVVWANQIPNVQEMSDIFSKNTAKSTGTNSFCIYGAPSALSATDYLNWSDQYEPAFDEVREALKRPYAIIPGDYSVPYLMPIPNFVTMRSVAQTLAQRAQCDFLLGRPDDALREVTLMHDICRILEKPPTGKPMTLVEAMINVAISGLYVATVADGFKLHSWQEPQMAALQEQLKAINLPPLVVAAFRTEPASSIHTFETTPVEKLADLFSMVVAISDDHKTKSGTFWRRLQNPMYLYLKIAPRGWWYQNLVNCAMAESKSIDGFDLEHDILLPPIFDANTRNLDRFFEHKSPFKLLAAIAIPNTTKAAQTLAHNQTLVNEAQIVCALERYRLAHGEYPETLDALVPQFIEKLPHDIIGGQALQGSGSASQPLHFRRTGDGNFLLYSVGWNETDDGGTASDKMDQGDWVWQYPAK